MEGGEKVSAKEEKQNSFTGEKKKKVWLLGLTLLKCFHSSEIKFSASFFLSPLISGNHGDEEEKNYFVYFLPLRWLRYLKIIVFRFFFCFVLLLLLSKYYIKFSSPITLIKVLNIECNNNNNNNSNCSYSNTSSQTISRILLGCLLFYYKILYVRPEISQDFLFPKNDLLFDTILNTVCKFIWSPFVS